MQRYKPKCVLKTVAEFEITIMIFSTHISQQKAGTTQTCMTKQHKITLGLKADVLF